VSFVSVLMAALEINLRETLAMGIVLIRFLGVWHKAFCPTELKCVLNAKINTGEHSMANVLRKRDYLTAVS